MPEFQIVQSGESRVIGMVQAVNGKIFETVYGCVNEAVNESDEPNLPECIHTRSRELWRRSDASWKMYVSHNGGHMLLPVDSFSTVTILNSGDYTLKVAQSAITKCWGTYPTILWRTGLLMTWSILPEDVIEQL